MTDQREVISLAAKQLLQLNGKLFDVLSLAKPISPDAALNLSKIVSKLSPLVGNLIEFNTVEFLNSSPEFRELQQIGIWKRQDPDFPDTIFHGKLNPAPGFEIKAWFPLATEITARFRDSQTRLAANEIYVALLAWLPEHLLYGRPQIIDVCIVSALSVARSRDDHYHRPPDYLVVEPLDTTSRSRNLQQTNTSGYKWQGTPQQFSEAELIVRKWGKDGASYRPTREYQKLVRQLLDKYPYRLDTNFAKMDRIVHGEIEAFKMRVYEAKRNGKSIAEWIKQLYATDDAAVRSSLSRHLDIKAGLGDLPQQGA